MIAARSIPQVSRKRRNAAGLSMNERMLSRSSRPASIAAFTGDGCISHGWMWTWASVTAKPSITTSSRVPAVEALPGLLAELPVRHHPAEELRRPERIRAQLAVEVLRDREPHVEPDEVRQAQRSHRMAIAERHRLVDVLGGSDPLLQHADRLEPEEHAQPARREPRRIADDDRLLPELPAHLERDGDGLVARLLGANDLEQRH